MRELRQSYKRHATLSNTASLNISFLEQCKVSHLTPKGLRLRKGCAAAAPSDHLRKQFQDILDEASLKLMDCLIEHYKEVGASSTTTHAELTIAMDDSVSNTSEADILLHNDILTRTVTNINKKKKNKTRNLSRKYAQLWKDAKRPGPHPPLLFEEDAPTGSSTRTEASTPSAEEGSEVRARSSVSALISEVRRKLPPFPPRRRLPKVPPKSPSSSSSSPSRSSSSPSSPSSDEGWGSLARLPRRTGVMTLGRSPYTPRTFPLRSPPLSFIPEVVLVLDVGAQTSPDPEFDEDSPPRVHSSPRSTVVELRRVNLNHSSSSSNDQRSPPDFRDRGSPQSS